MICHPCGRDRLLSSDAPTYPPPVAPGFDVPVTRPGTDHSRDHVASVPSWGGKVEISTRGCLRGTKCNPAFTCAQVRGVSALTAHRVDRSAAVRVNVTRTALFPATQNPSSCFLYTFVRLAMHRLAPPSLGENAYHPSLPALLSPPSSTAAAATAAAGVSDRAATTCVAKVDDCRYATTGPSIRPTRSTYAIVVGIGSR